MRKNVFLINKQNLFFLYFTLFVFTFLIILKISSPALASAAEVTIQWDIEFFFGFVDRHISQHEDFMGGKDPEVSSCVKANHETAGMSKWVSQ